MWRYLKLHEAFVREALAGKHGPISFAELKEFHDTQIRYMQHERLIHLIVMMFVATFFLLSLGYVLGHSSWPGLALVSLLLILTSAYVVHYFRLENGVQRWYHLASQIDRRLDRVCGNYEE